MQIIKTDTGYTITFPFELNASFRDAFPSAKWSQSLRCWMVGPRSGKRLEQWVEAAKEAAAALAERDQQTFTNDQLAALRAELRIVEEATRLTLEKAQQADAQREQLAALAQQLAEAQTRRQHAQASAEQSRAALVMAKADIDTLLAGVLDRAGVRRAMDTMGRNMSPASRTARAAFDEARDFVRAQRALLRQAGWRCAALSQLADANFNNPKRDHPRLIPESDWYVLTPVEPEDE